MINADPLRDDADMCPAPQAPAASPAAATSPTRTASTSTPPAAPAPPGAHAPAAPETRTDPDATALTGTARTDPAATALAALAALNASVVRAAPAGAEHPTPPQGIDLPTELGAFSLAPEHAAGATARELRPAVGGGHPRLAPGDPAVTERGPAQLPGSLFLAATTLGAVTALLAVANVVAVPGTRHVFNHGEQFVLVGATLALATGIAGILSLARRAPNGAVLASATAVGVTATTVLLVSGISALHSAATRYSASRTPGVPQSAAHPGSGRTGAWNDASDPSGPPSTPASPSTDAPASPSTPPSTPASSAPPSAAPSSAAHSAPNPYLTTQDTLLMDRALGKGSVWAGDDPAAGSCVGTSAGLPVRAQAAAGPRACLSGTAITDATMEMTLSLGASAGGGMALRREAKGSWYAAGIDAAGRAWLVPVASGVAGANLISGTIPGFDAGTRHLIAVTAVGPVLTLYVDNQRIGAASAATYPTGQVGAFATVVPAGGASPAGGPTTATVTVHRLRVWTA